MNPGGDENNAGHGEIDTAGSAYKIEDWSTRRHKFSPGRSPLQLQVRALFDGLDVDPDRVLAGNLVPFRSPDWKTLKNKSSAIRFGVGLWNMLIVGAAPELVILMGTETWNAFAADGRVREVEVHGFNWGNCVIRRGKIKRTKIVGLPHLSRFPIIGRAANDKAIEWAFGEKFNANLAR